jgi:ketosteroid isomerase-like protein
MFNRVNFPGDIKSYNTLSKSFFLLLFSYLRFLSNYGLQSLTLNYLRMKYSFLVIAAAIILSSCNQTEKAPNPEARKARLDSLNNDLFQTDLAFSQLSEQKGRNAAFIAYADENATMLRPFSMPINGKDSIVKLFGAHPDSVYTLSWKPTRANVARSGELGFTYGTYSLSIKNTGKEEGTYCTVWKKDKNHSWKFVLDTGNEGLNTDDKAVDKEVKSERDKLEKKKK